VNPGTVNPGAEDPLGPQVRGLFAALRHAGEPGAAPAGSTVRVLCGEAGREQRGTRVRFMLHLAGERLLEVRYRAYGCPYTLAACEWLAQQLESGGRDSIGGAAEWAHKLRIPPARLGRLLVVEDALRAALAAADKTVTDS
jgi:NifU-like protein involved in Fe-S cluster formation